MIYYVFLCAKSPKRRASGYPSAERTPGYPDALPVFEEDFFRPSANVTFPKQSGAAPHWGAAYAYASIASEIFSRSRRRIITKLSELFELTLLRKQFLWAFQMIRKVPQQPDADFLKIALEI